MTISFDLDDTLIPAQLEDFATEKRNYFQQIFNIEPLRKGTPIIYQYLKNNGHRVGVYTTSFRSKWKISIQFLSYGISLDFIINETQNRRVLKKMNKTISKYPPVFDIDLHVDDSKGVAMEGERHGFKTIIIEKEEDDWIEKIKRAILKIEE